MIATHWVCALGLSATLLFFPALRIYFGNYLYYNVSVAHAGFWLAAASLIAAGGLTALGAVMPRLLRQWYAALLVGLAFFAWVKAAFLGWDYGLFIGEPIDWDRYGELAQVDLAALLGLSGTALLFRRQVVARATALVAFLAIVQSVGLALLTPLAREADRAAILAKHTVDVEPRRSEKLSDAGNVIILLVDTLQSDVLAGWLAGDVRRREALAGFKFFHDTASGAGLTWLSVPNLLTGTMFDNQVPYPAYLDAAFDLPGSVLRNLRAAGYYVELDPWTNATPVPLRPQLVSNVRERVLSPAIEPLTSMLVVGAFTALPQFAQEKLHLVVLASVLQFLDSNSDNNLRFIRDNARLPIERVREPVFKLIHLRGPHVPLLEYGKYGFDYHAAAADENPPGASIGRFTRTNYVSVSAQMLDAVLRYLEKLRAAGAYDRSTIFVLGDHGGGRLGQRFIAPSGAPYAGAAGTISTGLQSSAAAALMVKPAGAVAPLAVSDAPAALSDVGATINHMLGRALPAADRSLSGESDGPSPRVRRFVDVSQIRFDVNGRLPPLTEYRVGAPMWLDSSWERTGRRFLAGGIRAADPVYALGELLIFGDGANALDYLDYGWRVPLKDAIRMWTDGHVARLSLPLAAPLAGAAVLELDAGPYAASSIVKVSVNGTEVGTLTVDRRRQYSVAIPAAVVRDKVLSLRFDLPDAISPAGAYGRADDGLLSLQVYRMRVVAVPAR